MRSALRFFAGIIITLLLVVAHMGATYFFAYPFTHIHVIFVGVVLFLVWSQSGTVVWISFFAHFVIELYSHTPFGIILFSATIATLICYWIFQYIVTNKSVLATTVLAACVILVYRIIYSVLVFGVSVFSEYQAPALGVIVAVALWEMLFASLCVSVSYMILRAFPKFSMSK